jgi:hypothetical protein
LKINTWDRRRTRPYALAGLLPWLIERPSHVAMEEIKLSWWKIAQEGSLTFCRYRCFGEMVSV